MFMALPHRIGALSDIKLHWVNNKNMFLHNDGLAGAFQLNCALPMTSVRQVT